MKNKMISAVILLSLFVGTILPYDTNPHNSAREQRLAYIRYRMDKMQSELCLNSVVNALNSIESIKLGPHSYCLVHPSNKTCSITSMHCKNMEKYNKLSRSITALFNKAKKRRKSENRSIINIGNQTKTTT